MSREISRQTETDLNPQRIVWIFKMAIGSLSGLLLAAAIFVSFSFSWPTTGVLIAFALLAAWISTKLRD